MLPAERRQKMARIINELGAVNTKYLAEALGISIMTVRRDLKILAEQKQLEITWGGAVPVNFQAHDIPYHDKMGSMHEAKEAIARVALDLVTDNSFLTLDAGTTTLALAHMLAATSGERNLTVVTPDLQIALILAACPHITVHVAGGMVDPVSRACNDSITMEFLRAFQPDIAFMGTNVWNLEHGVSTSSRPKMHIKRQLLLSARKCVLLADSSKYAHYSPWKVATLDEFFLIITDRSLPDATAEALEDAGIVVKRAPAGQGRAETPRPVLRP